jgi:putative hydrolase of the HAD superfamily
VRKIDAVLFDFGGVFTASPFTMIHDAGAELGHDPALLLELMFGPYGDDTDHPWHCLERGEMTFADCQAAISALGATHGIELDILKMFMGRPAASTTPPPRTALIDRTLRLRAEGTRTGLVTNNIKEFGETWRKMVPVDDLFEVIIDSSHEGIRKPNPAIFHLALDRLGGVAADRTVFLDDYPGNITAAEALGMHGILVGDDWERAIAELDEVLAI